MHSQKGYIGKGVSSDITNDGRNGNGDFDMEGDNPTPTAGNEGFRGVSGVPSFVC